MDLLILKSDVTSQKGVRKLSRVLDPHPGITRWTVDLDDCDKVLRIELARKLTERDVQRLILPLGYHCEDLKS